MSRKIRDMSNSIWGESVRPGREVSVHNSAALVPSKIKVFRLLKLNVAFDSHILWEDNKEHRPLLHRLVSL